MVPLSTGHWSNTNRSSRSNINRLSRQDCILDHPGLGASSELAGRVCWPSQLDSGRPHSNLGRESDVISGLHVVFRSTSAGPRGLGVRKHAMIALNRGVLKARGGLRVGGAILWLHRTLLPLHMTLLPLGPEPCHFEPSCAVRSKGEHPETF